MQMKMFFFRGPTTSHLGILRPLSLHKNVYISLIRSRKSITFGRSDFFSPSLLNNLWKSIFGVAESSWLTRRNFALISRAKRILSTARSRFSIRKYHKRSMHYRGWKPLKGQPRREISMSTVFINFWMLFSGSLAPLRKQHKTVDKRKTVSKKNDNNRRQSRW